MRFCSSFFLHALMKLKKSSLAEILDQLATQTIPSGITDEEIAYMLAVLEFQLQQFDRTANHAALQLHNAAIKGDPAVHGGEEPEGSFASYVCGLYGRAVF